MKFKDSSCTLSFKAKSSLRKQKMEWSRWELNPKSLPKGLPMFLAHKKVGALLRCYAFEPKLVENAVTLTVASVERMLSVQVGGYQFVSRVEILVPIDPAYAEKDCGLTAPKLREVIKARGWRNVLVTEVENGDLFCVVLNRGVGNLMRSGCSYMTILSKEAESYFTPETVEDIVEALSKKALVVPVAFADLTESVMQGQAANTFCTWDLDALSQVGNFDLRAAKPRMCPAPQWGWAFFIPLLFNNHDFI